MLHRETDSAAPEWDTLSEDERRALAVLNLEDWQDRTALPSDPGGAAPLLLFPLPDAGCEGCSAAIAEGQTQCRACTWSTA